MSGNNAIPPDLNLLSGEEVVRVIRPVLKGYLNELFGLLVVIGLTGLLLLLEPFGEFFPIGIVVALGLFVGALLIIGPAINLVGHSYIITDRRVIGRFDFIVHRESTIYFEKVQNVRVRQGIFDSFVNTGMVTIETAAGAMLPEETLRWISGPRDLRGHIMKLIEKHRGGSDGLGGSSSSSGARMSASGSHSVLSDILLELKGIREDLGKK